MSSSLPWEKEYWEVWDWRKSGWRDIYEPIGVGSVKIFAFSVNIHQRASSTTKGTLLTASQPVPFPFFLFLSSFWEHSCLRTSPLCEENQVCDIWISCILCDHPFRKVFRNTPYLNTSTFLQQYMPSEVNTNYKWMPLYQLGSDFADKWVAKSICLEFLNVRILDWRL